MRTSSVGLYALRLSFGQASNVSSQSTANAFATAATPDRVVKRSATMMAVFGIAISSFSLKQMMANNSSNKATPAALTLRKF